MIRKIGARPGKGTASRSNQCLDQRGAGPTQTQFASVGRNSQGDLLRRWHYDRERPGPKPLRQLRKEVVGRIIRQFGRLLQ